MKKPLLATVAAAALVASSGFAMAQGTAKEPSAPKAGATEMHKSGADMHRGSADMHNGARMKGESGTTGQGSDLKGDVDTQAKPGNRSEDKSDHRSNMKSESRPNAAERKTDEQSNKRRTEERSNTRTRAQDERQPGSKAAQDHKGSSATTGQGAAASAPVTLTTEQKTSVRKTMIESRGAPRVERNNIKFNISVGTVVPRSVHIVAVPDTLIRIHPAWRGYRYFVVGDEIIIVEPRTFKIIAVLDV
jgi:hypothetical protein